MCKVVKLWSEVIIRLVVVYDLPVAMSKYGGKWMKPVQDTGVESQIWDSAQLNQVECYTLILGFFPSKPLFTKIKLATPVSYTGFIRLPQYVDIATGGSLTTTSVIITSNHTALPPYTCHIPVFT